MNTKNKTYEYNVWNVVITPLDGKPYEIQIDTEDIEWSMEQYQRNRKPLNYKLYFKV